MLARPLAGANEIPRDCGPEYLYKSEINRDPEKYRYSKLIFNDAYLFRFAVLAHLRYWERR